MSARTLTRRQVLRRRRLVVLAGLLCVVLGTGTLMVKTGQAAWAAASERWGENGASASGPNSPAWVAAPSADIRHDLDPEGLAKDGTINPDKGQIIWFTGSQRVAPGELGIAVVAGHVEYHSKPDAFARLSTLKIGDRVQIGQEDGDVLNLTVRSATTMGKEELRRSDLVWGDARDKRLVALVTCDDALGLRDDGHRAANYVAIAEVD